jgi:hypothetical protein
MKQTLVFRIRSTALWCLITFALAAVSPCRAEPVGIDGALATLAGNLADQIAEANVSRIGVLEFLNNSPQGEVLGGNTGSAGRYAAEKLEEGLVKSARGRFQVVERQRLESVVREIELQVSDLVRQDPLRKLSGQVEGLDGLVLGTMTRLHARMDVSVRVIEPATAVNRGMESTTIAVTPDLGALFGESVYIPPRLDGGQPTAREVVEAFSPPPDEPAPRPHPLADPLSAMPYSVRVFVDGNPVEALFKDREMIVGVAPGLRYAIELGNQSDKTVAVSLLIDGLNTIGQERTQPSQGRKWVLSPGRKALIRGWQIGDRVAREFIFTGADQSLAFRKGFFEDIGLITACFYPEQTDGDMTVRGFVGTGEGAEIESRVREVRLKHEATPAAIINIRYDLPEVVQTMRERAEGLPGGRQE